MPALVHTSFRVSNAKQFKESFLEIKDHGIEGFIPTSIAPDSSGNYLVTAGALATLPSNVLDDQMYLFIGKVSKWVSTDTPDGTPDPNINENNPPNPIDSVKHGNFDHWDDMIAAKRVTANEVSHVIKRERPLEIQAGKRGWESGLRYEQYDDRFGDNSGGRVGILFDDDVMHHTMNSLFRVYKCIKTGLGKFQKITTSGGDRYLWDYKSYEEPLSTATTGGITEDFMVQGKDGYQWKYMYTIAAGEALKFVTTSYIPVKTLRREDGSRTNDFSDQYQVEGNALDGAILNVVVDKVAEYDASVLLGYEPQGGDGYFQFGANTAPTILAGANTMTFEFSTAAIQDCLFPGVDGGYRDNAGGANNIFDFATAGAAKTAMETNGSLIGYGVVVNHPNYSKYVFPISGHNFDAVNSMVHLEVDSTFFGLVKTDMDTSVVPTTCDIEVHPYIQIESNYDSSSATSPVDSLQAYCIVEPTFNTTSEQYNQTAAGRIIDVKVVNAGSGHKRIDSTTVSPVTLTPASVHACIAPVGGHGFDPVEELGGFNVMINARFEGSESDEFTVGNEFRKIGILKNPLNFDAPNLWMGDRLYDQRYMGLKADQCYRVNLTGTASAETDSNVTLKFEPDMVVEFSEGGGTPFATATIVDHDDTVHRIRLIEPRGDFQRLLAGSATGFDVKSVTQHSVALDNVVAVSLNNVGGNVTATTPEMKAGSGKIIFTEHRSAVSRSQNQTESLSISIQF